MLGTLLCWNFAETELCLKCALERAEVTQASTDLALPGMGLIATDKLLHLWAVAHLTSGGWEKDTLGHPHRLSGIPGSFLLCSRVRRCKVWLVNVITGQPQDATESPSPQ